MTRFRQQGVRCYMEMIKVVKATVKGLPRIILKIRRVKKVKRKMEKRKKRRKRRRKKRNIWMNKLRNSLQ